MRRQEANFFIPTSRPSEARCFIHKRIIGGVVGGIRGGYSGALKGFITGGRNGTAANGVTGAGSALTQTVCTTGFVKDASGNCVARSMVGVAIPRHRTSFLPIPTGKFGVVPPSQDFFGDAVMGQYGVALAPMVACIDHMTCPDGMLLGTDDLCYNKGQISNKQRKWPKGRAPLLTGGERNCISKAARAAKKIERTTKQLQKMGMLKKATSRRSPPMGRLSPGRAPGTSIINVE